MTSIVCPVCGYSAQHFEAVGVNRLRENAKCPGCGSYERHRLVWWYLKDSNLLSDGMQILDVAPMPAIAKAIKSEFNIDYVSIDLGNRQADMRMDLENLTFPDNRFDGIFCMHVLEHVDNDRKALSELARVLRPGGWAVLMVPINENMPTTDEDPTVTDPQERIRRFGQADHVRLYGADYLTRCQQAGFRMQVIHITAEDVIKKHAFLPNEKIYMGWRD